MKHIQNHLLICTHVMYVVSMLKSSIAFYMEFSTPQILVKNQDLIMTTNASRRANTSPYKLLPMVQIAS